jgi:hypothetical protein
MAAAAAAAEHGNHPAVATVHILQVVMVAMEVVVVLKVLAAHNLQVVLVPMEELQGKAEHPMEVAVLAEEADITVVELLTVVIQVVAEVVHRILVE